MNLVNLEKVRLILTDVTPRNNRWNLHLMDIGDSFEIAYDSVEVQRLRAAICNNYAKRNNKRFITRREDDRLIVWRVE